MPFELKVEADEALKQLGEIQKRIADLEQETALTFVAWQLADMHRHFPKVEGSGLSVSTMIYPRSQLRRFHQRGAKTVRRRSIVAASRPGAQHRPILRPELFDMLKTRMIDMVKEACTWR